MNFIHRDKIVWKKVNYLRQGESLNYDYTLYLNEPLASWDVWDYWERERIESMRANLKKGDILFDIGTEQGWCNLVYATMVGPENMVLIEPTPEFWPNIKALWEKNYNVKPRAFYEGFFSDKTTEKGDSFTHWPFEALGDEIIDRNSYKYIYQDRDIPQITIDDYVARTGIIPTALTMDTEGAELLILNGAKKTLAEGNINVWVSEHDDMAKRDYGINANDIADFMKRLGYSRKVLATDHERHVFYKKQILL